MKNKDVRDEPTFTHHLERLDDLVLDSMKIYQRSDQFCFSIDAILLSYFVQSKSKDRYIDLGTGTGVIPLVTTSLGAGSVTGVEINPIMADLARRSVGYNKKDDVVRIVEGDYRRMSLMEVTEDTPHKGKPFDAVFVNPPYYGEKMGALSKSLDVATALHEDHTNLEDVVQAAKRFVKFKGHCYMIFTSPRLAYAIMILSNHNFEIKRLRFVYSFPRTESKLVLIDAVLGGNSGVIVEKPLYIYDEPNVYSEEVRGWYE